MRLHVGTSGWMYDHWRGIFYPAGLPKARWLPHYAAEFSTVEINNSFYHLPTEKAFASWREKAPEGFVYAVKASRYITHMKKLHDAAEPLGTFISRVRLLGPSLGPVLYQVPPGLKRNDSLLESFLDLLPGDLRHVFEFRDPSWFHDSSYSLLARHNAAFCIYDMTGTTTPLAKTADFAYVRFHGSGALYDSRYTDAQLDSWAEKLAVMAGGTSDLYVYFNNDSHGYAIENARRLRDILRVRIR